MFVDKIDNLLYYFDISGGKYACIKKIHTMFNHKLEDKISQINIPSEVHYENKTYIVNSISGYTTEEKVYTPVTTDRRRKDYGREICTGTRTREHFVMSGINEWLHWDAEIILPETITEIGPFVVCGSYGRFVLNDGLRIIRSGAFRTYRQYKMTIPSSVKVIECEAFIDFSNYTHIKELIVDNEPGSVKIHERAFVYYSEFAGKRSVEIVYLRPKTSWFSKLIKKLK